jgi:anthranilate phosphoribosyltransferase
MHILRRMHAEISEHLPELRRGVGPPAAREGPGRAHLSITAKSMSSSSPENNAIHAALDKATAEKDLTRAEAESAMEEILSGRSNDSQIAALLTALHMKGETVDELVGFATAMRRHATPIFPPGHKRPAAEMIVDTCGTGGDASGTFNISTAAAFVVAGAGVRVAKHGNRSISSRCGSADVLEQLGVKIDLAPERIGRAIEEVGIGFLFAPAIHAATRHAMPARRALRMRTVFNLLGPLTNPANASAQVVGVYDADFTELVARALGELGVRRAFVVHGADGLDEISLARETCVAELRDGVVRSYTVTPEDFGLRRAPLDEIRGGDAKQNAEIIHKILGRSMLYHEHGPHREIVLANAAAALVAAGRAVDFPDGARIAAHSIDSGAARERLEALVAFSQAESSSSSLAAN